jgi:[ribosomal protein S5]-alanine N-acetyltransferase
MSLAPEEFRTARLHAWRISARDLVPMAAMNADPRVMEALGGVGDEEESRRWVERKAAHWRTHGFGVYVVAEAPDGDAGRPAAGAVAGRVVGRAGLQYAEVDDVTVIELMYALRHEEWGKGFAAEATRNLLTIAFGAMRLPEIVAVVMPDNSRSRRVVEKLGFTYESMAMHEGERHRLYRMTKAAWAELRSGHPDP